MDSTNNTPPFDLPTLEELKPLAGWLGVVRALAGGGSGDYTAYALQANAVRLCQAAISEYQQGVAAVRAFHQNRQDLTALHWIIVSVNNFESCLWNLERFIKHARTLRSLVSAESELKRLIPRNLSFFQQDAESRITRLRHRISHLESAVLKGEIADGGDIMVRPVERGLTLGNMEICWEELEEWLRDVHTIAERLAEFVPD